MKHGVLIANWAIFGSVMSPSCIATLGVEENVRWVNVPDCRLRGGVRVFYEVGRTPRLTIFREEGHA